MELPTIISDLLKAQANFNSADYAHCFSPAAIVYDEGETHQGKKEIQAWNEKTNKKYSTQLEPIGFSTGNVHILTTKLSGTFEGSPIILKFHFELKNELIESLRITD